MNALLLIAHGSRNPRSTAEIFQLVDNLRQSRSDCDLVEGCFLEITEPTIAQGIEKLVNSGAKRINILPYFLAQGNHVIRDIPDTVEPVSSRYSDVEINVLPYIGAADGMLNMINQHIDVSTG